jgi:hypothetical protein
MRTCCLQLLRHYFIYIAAAIRAVFCSYQAVLVLNILPILVHFSNHIFEFAGFLQRKVILITVLKREIGF